MNGAAKPAAGDPPSQTTDLFLELIHEGIDRPVVAVRLPDAGQVALQSVDFHDHLSLCAAFKPPAGGVWTAYIVRAKAGADASEDKGSVGDDGRMLRDRDAIVRTLTATEADGKAALDALEGDLCARVVPGMGALAVTGSRATA